MIQRVYLFLYGALFLLLFFGFLALFLLTSKEIVPLLAQKYLKESGLEYAHIEGTLLGGVTLHALKYGDVLRLKKLEVHYSLFTLLREVPTIDSLSIEGLYLNMDRGFAGEDTRFALPLSIAVLRLKNAEVVIDAKSYIFDGEGTFESGVLKAEALLRLTPELLKEYFWFAQGGAKSLKVTLEASQTSIHAKTKNISFALSADENLRIQNGALQLNYFIDDGYFTAQAEYGASYMGYEALVQESAHFTREGAFHTQADVRLTQQPLALPFQSFSFEVSGDAHAIVAEAKAEKLKLNLLYKSDSSLLRGALQSELPSLPSLSFTLHEENQEQILNLYADALNITLQKRGESLYAKGSFDLAKSKLLEKGMFDGKMDLNASLTFTDALRIEGTLHMPKARMKLDSKTIHSVKDVSINFSMLGDILKIQKYSFKFMEHTIYSKKPSTLSFDAQTIHFEEFWIYDTLLLRAKINPSEMSGNLHLISDGYVYKDEENTLTLRGEINASFAPDMPQKIDGNITIVEGIIGQEIPRQLRGSDSDIIIIQEIQEKPSQNYFLNLYIKALKPIVYKNKDVDILFTPDLRVTQEPKAEMKIFGMLRINEGEIREGEKTFVFDKSELYFNGEFPLNPHLNLNLHYYTLEQIDIEIYITNTLSKPVLILASKPAMSQDDIMSYILFGESARSVFEGSGESSKLSLSAMLLGSGLKQIFNKSTGVKVDTLNILTNKEGTLGYEIGSRFNKQIRVVYKNDTISSVIIQYSLTKSIRIEVDARETGQGVSVIYVKDF